MTVEIGTIPGLKKWACYVINAHAKQAVPVSTRILTGQSSSHSQSWWFRKKSSFRWKPESRNSVTNWKNWIPAFAGMTKNGVFRLFTSSSILFLNMGFRSIPDNDVVQCSGHIYSGFSRHGGGLTVPDPFFNFSPNPSSGGCVQEVAVFFVSTIEWI